MTVGNWEVDGLLDGVAVVGDELGDIDGSAENADVGKRVVGVGESNSGLGNT